MSSTTAIIKTKYNRKNAKGSESFTQYQILVNNGYPSINGQTIHFPKGTTLPQIRKAYPQYADITVHVMPSETLRGGRLAKCEEISGVTVQAYRLAEPIEAVVIPAATAEELAADLVDTPDQIQLIKQAEAPTAEPQPETEMQIQDEVLELCLTQQAAEEADFNAALADHYENLDKQSEHRRRSEGDAPALSHARHALAEVKDWATFNEWVKANPAFALARKKDGGRVVSFEEYSDKVVTLELDNDKTAYPYYHVLSRYFDVVPA